MMSIALLCFGILVFWLKKKLSYTLPVGVYLFGLLLIEMLSLIWGHYFRKSGLILFTLSFFLHFVFLSVFYQNHLFQLKRKWVILTIGLGALPLFLSQITSNVPTGFQSYDRAIYSFVIMLYSLYFLYQLIQGRNWKPEEVLLNSSVLIFFALDTFLKKFY